MLKEILKIITIIAVTQVVLLIIHIFRNKSNSFSRFILAILFIAFGIFLTGNTLLFYMEDKIKYKIAHILNLTVFLTAPLLFLYSKARIEGKKNIEISDFYHLLPFIVVFSFMFLKLIVFSNKLASFRPYAIVLLSGLFIQNLFYFLHITKMLKETKKKRNEIKSQVNQSYSWINKLYYLFSGILLSQLGIFISCTIFKHLDVCMVFTGIFFLITFFLINNIVLFGLSGSSAIIQKEKYQFSYINNDTNYLYENKLKQVLENEKVYMDPLLTLDRLSRITLIPKNTLSRLINEKFGMNFNDLINQYRIDAAKQYLLSVRHSYSILDIAYEVGFNSKSTFNTAFKRYTGSTPSEYVNKHAVLN